jgi:hypothetical protein
MGRRSRTVGAAMAAAILGTLVAASSASATYHEIKIRAVFEGVAAHTAFVELQMYADGQNQTLNRHITVWDHTGLQVHSSPAFPNVAQGQNQRTILVGDNAAAGSPDVVDATLRSALVADGMGGAVCYDVLDCVAWGTWAPSDLAKLPSPAGTPIAGLATNFAYARNIVANCPTALDAADDTDNSAADFFATGGFPVRNNSVTPTEVVCPPTPTPTSTGTTPTKKCKKAKKKRSAEVAKKCKKKKKK